MVKKPKEKFKIIVKSSSLPEEEKRKILFECYDIILGNSNSSKDPSSKRKNQPAGGGDTKATKTC